MNATSAEQASAPVTEDALRSVLLAGERPSRPGPVLTSLTFGWRALLKIKHVPEQLVDVTMFPIMFTLMFTYLFGGALAGSTQEYLQFLLPGILVQANVMITMNTGITLNTDIPSMCAPPIAPDSDALTPWASVPGGQPTLIVL